MANSMASEPSAVQVVVRVRPLRKKERLQGQHTVVHTGSDNSKLLLQKKQDPRNPYLSSGKAVNYHYTFDRTYGPLCTQQEIYHESARPLVEAVTSGKGNATILAYGPTGAGKTYTMMGTRRKQWNNGLVALVADDIFDQMKERHTENWWLGLSYLEIYNERVRDLLAARQPRDPDTISPPRTTRVEVREDAAKGVVRVSALREVHVRDASHVLQLLKRGNARRRAGYTHGNDMSSRSHALLKLRLHHCDTSITREHGGPPGGSNLSPDVTVLSLIDLAGSERLATNHGGVRGSSREAAYINKSLLALNNCINALSSHDFNWPRCLGHVRYRDSKLTLLLKSALVPRGDSRLLLIANVSPAERHFSESRNTLKYAGRAKSIRARRTHTPVPEASPAPPPPPTSDDDSDAEPREMAATVRAGRRARPATATNNSRRKPTNMRRRRRDRHEAFRSKSSSADWVRTVLRRNRQLHSELARVHTRAESLQAANKLLWADLQKAHEKVNRLTRLNKTLKTQARLIQTAGNQSARELHPKNSTAPQTSPGAGGALRVPVRVPVGAVAPSRPHPESNITTAGGMAAPYRLQHAKAAPQWTERSSAALGRPVSGNSMHRHSNPWRVSGFAVSADASRRRSHADNTTILPMEPSPASATRRRDVPFCHQPPPHEDMSFARHAPIQPSQRFMQALSMAQAGMFVATETPVSSHTVATPTTHMPTAFDSHLRGRICKMIAEQLRTK